MNEKFNDCIKELSPELQEKAKGIKSNEELNDFLAENDIELPEDVLESVSGGEGCFTFGGPDACPKGGDHEWTKLQVLESGITARFRCTKCGEETVKGNL